MIKFMTKYERPDIKGEFNSGESLVETAGYIPAERQIMQLIDAGKRLDSYNKSQYDFVSIDDDDGSVDPTRRLDYDMAEASQGLAEVTRMIDESNKLAENGDRVVNDGVAESDDKEKEEPEEEVT